MEIPQDIRMQPTELVIWPLLYDVVQVKLLDYKSKVDGAPLQIPTFPT